jgi:nicotinate-nucleotide pyrophosphorylase (carboxylating)
MNGKNSEPDMKPDPHISTLIDLALSEDLGSGDVTSGALFGSSARSKASLVAREPLVVSGLEVAGWVFDRLDDGCSFKPAAREGEAIRQGSVMARVSGSVRALLSAERTALNFVRHLSGIATLTRSYADALQDTGCRLLDTRKTTPGLRTLEKAAVRAGGGHNHRMGLFDGAMIKDNHIAAAGSIRAAVDAVRAKLPPTVKIEVECDNLGQVREALRAGADIIMLDNMTAAKMKKAVALVAGGAAIEASGGLNLDNVRRAAEAGVDYVSVGALTQGVRAVDISMELG